MQYKTIILVDGENLTVRYKGMLDAGRIPREENVFIENSFVWNPNIPKTGGTIDIVRTGYYTTVVGDENKIDAIKTTISETEFKFTTISHENWSGTLVPYVYKKQNQKAKTKSVDINLSIDALRYAYGNSIDQIILISGDGDYIPLLREIMSRGKMVQCWALSDGLNPDLKHNVDDLIILDKMLFIENNLQNT